MKIILVFKTHFDIGFTRLASEIVGQYSGQMLSDVVETCNSTTDMGRLRYVWTMPAWPLKAMQGCEPEKRGELDRLVREGQIVFHALPFTSHTDFCGMADTIEGLRYASDLAAEYGVPLPVSAKMTDVPGHGRSLPMLLVKAGIKFLHLGCNAFATPPAVPPLFFWQAPDGSCELTMYSKGGYGSGMIPPEDWPFPVWMALMHTHDNIGPQSADIIRAMVAEARESCPDAEIVCGTMDDFYHELAKCDLSGLPVVTGDLADSWIHGVGSYPVEVGIVRQARRDIAVATAAVFTAGGDKKALAEDYRATYDELALFGEHTWGLDVKTWMNAQRVYDKKKFRAVRETAEYLQMERSWQEQAGRARRALVSADRAISRAELGEGAVLNPNGGPFTGWAQAEGAPGAIRLCGKDWLYIRDVPPLAAVKPEAPSYPPSENVLENHRYRLTLDRERGLITELYDKALGRPLAQERDGVGVFSYRYDVYGIEDITEFLRSYGYRFWDWGVRDYGRDNYPECPHRTFVPVCTGVEESGYTLVLRYASSASEAYGDGREIRISVALPPEGEELLVSAEITWKEGTPYVESGSLCLPLAAENPTYRLNKNGDIIDPAKDIVDCANHALYCLESFACAEEGGAGVCVVTKDAPLCAIGETGIYTYRKRYEPHAPILYFNLFNNMWGTNFPQWIGGDLRFDFILFGYEDFRNEAVMSRAMALDRGAQYLPLADHAAPITVPEGMQILRLKPEAEGWRLCLRDTAMMERQALLRADGWRICPTDLRGGQLGDFEDQQYAFVVKPLSIYEFKLKK